MTSWSLPGQAIVVRFTGKVNASLERHFWRWASLFLILLLACFIARDLRSKLWIDELFSLNDAKQSGPSEIIKTITEGSDSAPPLYAIIVYAILPIVKNEALAVRLPATLGFCGMVLCLLAFCRRRIPAIYSFLAVLLVCDVCLYYSTEGRAYGLVLGFAAAALLCWQSAAEGNRRGLTIPLFALCLSAMVALHYYAIFFLGPLILAEMARAWTTRKPDFRVWIAMTAPLVTLGLHYPLIAAIKQFEAHFWSHAHLGMIPSFYHSFFFDPYIYLWPLALIVLAVFPESPSRQSVHEESMPAHEWVAIGALALMPAVVVVISELTTGIFVDRYILWAVIGIALFAGALVCKAVRGNTSVGVMLTCVLVALLFREGVASLCDAPTLRYGEAILRELEMLPNGPELIVIPNARVFMEIYYYGEPRLRERLIYPVNRDLDLRYRGYDTDSLLMVPFSHRVKLNAQDVRLNVEEYDAILARYPQFLLAANPSDYLPSHMRTTGYRVDPIRPEASPPVLFEVRASKVE